MPLSVFPQRHPTASQEIGERPFSFSDGCDEGEVGKIGANMTGNVVKTSSKDGSEYCGIMRRALLNKRILMSVVALSIATSLTAGDFSRNSQESHLGKETIDGVEYFFYTNEGEKCSVLDNENQCAVNISDERTTLVLPETLGGMPLVAIGCRACKDLIDVEEIKLPSGLMRIGHGAFEGCSSLKLIVIPKCINKIGARVFKDCEKLSAINLPKGINIDECTFEGCTGLKEIVLPDGIETLPNFRGCASLTTIKIPRSVKKMKYVGSFRGCVNLQKLVLPSGIEEIPISAFEGCEKLSTVMLPDTIKEIGGGAFMGCSSLKGINLPYKISKIEACLLKGCSSLESIVIPENVESIGPCAFDGCAVLKEIVLPASLKSIANGAFDGCHNIRKIKTPASVRDWVLNLKMEHLYDSKSLKDRTEIDIEITK